MADPLLSIIVPCYNGHSFISPFFSSLEAQDYSLFEVILVDNGSSPPIEKPSSAVPTRLFRNKTNLGYTGGVNQGVSKAKGSVFLILNIDLALESQFLSIFMGRVSLSLNQLYGFHIINQKTERTESLGLFLTPLLLRGKNSIKENHFLGPTGAAFALTKQTCHILSEKGCLMDQNFFFLWEDIELAYRARIKNIPTIIYNDLKCKHLGNHTKSSYFYKQYLSLRNRFYLVQKHIPRYLWKYFLALIVYDVPRIIFFLLLNPYRFQWLKEWKYTPFKKE